jgi:hypothetical protein
VSVNEVGLLSTFRPLHFTSHLARHPPPPPHLLWNFNSHLYNKNKNLLCPHHPNPLTHTHIWCNLSRIDWLISLIMIQFMFVSLPSRLHPFLFSPSPKNYYRDFVLFCLSLLFFNIFCSSLFKYFMFVIWSCRIYSCTWWCSNYYFNQVYVSTITLNLNHQSSSSVQTLWPTIYSRRLIYLKKKTTGLLRRIRIRSIPQNNADQ